MSTYLLTWNPNRWHWRDLQADVRSFNRYRHFSTRWSCGNTKKIVPYDRLFLLRFGGDPSQRGICASGWATSEVQVGEHWDKQQAARGKKTLYVDVVVDAMLDSDNEPIFPRARLNDGIYSRMHWDSQASGITIPDEVAARLEEEWKAFFGHSPLEGVKSAIRKIRSEYKPVLQFSEGGVKEVTVEIRRRDPRLRVQAIASYGTTCIACGLNFGEFYGELGDGYIEVHHLRPLSSRKTRRKITVDEVRVVCANCHRILHRHGAAPITIDELKKRIKEQR